MISTTPARTSSAYNSRNGGVNACATTDTIGSAPTSIPVFATPPRCRPETNSR